MSDILDPNPDRVQRDGPMREPIARLGKMITDRIPQNLDGENPNHEKRWVLPRYVPGSAEFTNMNEDIISRHPEMGRFFERMSFLPLEKVTSMVPPGGSGIGMHVIPVEKAIGMEERSLSI